MKTLIKSLVVLLVLLGAVALKSESVQTIIFGHTQDLISRVSADQVVTGSVTAQGTFDELADGRDAAHWADGTVKIIEKDGKRYIQLTEDFNSGPLPDGYVYFSVSTDINNNTDFDSSVQIEAGKLLKGSGASFYEIPQDAVVNSVTILCKQFHVYIGSADIN